MKDFDTLWEYIVKNGAAENSTLPNTNPKRWRFKSSLDCYFLAIIRSEYRQIILFESIKDNFLKGLGLEGSTCSVLTENEQDTDGCFQKFYSILFKRTIKVFIK
jgi:hypothetical protein